MFFEWNENQTHQTLNDKKGTPSYTLKTNFAVLFGGPSQIANESESHEALRGVKEAPTNAYQNCLKASNPCDFLNGLKVKLGKI